MIYFKSISKLLFERLEKSLNQIITTSIEKENMQNESHLLLSIFKSLTSALINNILSIINE